MAFFHRVLFATLCTLSATAGKTDPLELVADQSKEVFRPGAEISGALVVGVQMIRRDDEAEDDDKMSDALRFQATLPKLAKEAFVCVSMLSSDGLYESQNTYESQEAWQGGDIVIDYTGAYPEVLEELKPDELAIYASPGSCSANDRGTVYPVAWRPTLDTDGYPLRLFVNGFHADEVYIYPGEEATEPVLCHKPDARVQTAFDFVCDFTLSEPGSLEIEINRVKGGRVSPPDVVVLHVGAPE